MQASGSAQFIDASRLDLKKYAGRPVLSKVLCDFLLYHDHAPRQALELCAAATVEADYKDWWWKARLGLCYYQLGLLRDAERQFKSSNKEQPMVSTVLMLCKVYVRLDQPNNAIKTYEQALINHPNNTCLLLGLARTYDQLMDHEKSTEYHKKVLKQEPSNVEAIASLAANHFYTDQPEIALRFYRRLLQSGVNNTELWNNIGLCCFYASQYDLTLSCFERALTMASDANMADVWYNVGQVAIGIGDLGLAYQAFKIAVSVDSHHAEAFDNLGVLELRKGNIEQARSNFKTAQDIAPFLFEPFFNGALLAYKLGDFQEAFELVEKALVAFPDHSDSKELRKQLSHQFTML